MLLGVIDSSSFVATPPAVTWLFGERWLVAVVCSHALCGHVIVWWTLIGCRRYRKCWWRTPSLYEKTSASTPVNTTSWVYNTVYSTLNLQLSNLYRTGNLSSHTDMHTHNLDLWLFEWPQAGALSSSPHYGWEINPHIWHFSNNRLTIQSSRMKLVENAIEMTIPSPPL